MTNNPTPRIDFLIQFTPVEESMILLRKVKVQTDNHKVRTVQCCIKLCSYELFWFWKFQENVLLVVVHK